MGIINSVNIDISDFKKVEADILVICQDFILFNDLSNSTSTLDLTALNLSISNAINTIKEKYFSKSKNVNKLFPYFEWLENVANIQRYSIRELFLITSDANQNFKYYALDLIEKDDSITRGQLLGLLFDKSKNYINTYRDQLISIGYPTELLNSRVKTLKHHLFKASGIAVDDAIKQIVDQTKTLIFQQIDSLYCAYITSICGNGLAVSRSSEFIQTLVELSNEGKNGLLELNKKYQSQEVKNYIDDVNIKVNDIIRYTQLSYSYDSNAVKQLTDSIQIPLEKTAVIKKANDSNHQLTQEELLDGTITPSSIASSRRSVSRKRVQSIQPIEKDKRKSIRKN